MRPCVSAAIAGALAAVVVLAALLPAEPRTLVLDNAGLFLGEVVEACRAWSSGRLPEWSDSIWAGFPLLGDSAVGALYPPNLIACLLTPPWHVRLFDVLAAIHLGLLVAGTVLLLRLLGLGSTAALLGGLLALLCPAPHFSGVAYMPVLAAVAWWPWGCVAAERLARPGTPVLGGAMLVGWVALAAQVLAGVPEQAVYGASLASWWLVMRRAGLGVGARLVRLSVLGAGAAALAAPQLLATAAYLPITERGGPVGTMAAQVVSLWLTEPVTLLVPGRGALNGTPAFFGVATLALAAVGCGSRRAPAMFLGAVAAGGFLLALGPQTPLYGLLHAAPPFNRFRSPLKFQAMAELATVWLAAVGLDVLSRQSRAWVRAVGAALVLAALCERMTYLLDDEAAAILALQPKVRSTVEAMAALAESSLPQRRRPDAPPPLVLDIFSKESALLGTNMTALLGISTVTGGGVSLLSRLHASLVAPRPRTRAMLDLFGVELVVASRRSCAAAARFFRLPLVEETKALCVLENPSHGPRYELLTAVTAVDSEAEMEAAVRTDAGRPVPVVRPPAGFGSADTAPTGAIAGLADRPGRARLRATVPRDELLLVRDSWVPGWEARLDGRSVPIHQAAGIYFAVAVPAGVHEVEIAYHAPGFRPGLSIAAMWSAGSWWMWLRLRRRRGKAATSAV